MIVFSFGMLLLLARQCANGYCDLNEEVSGIVEN